MADEMSWIVVEKFSKDIGAIGFIGDSAVVVVAFYDDYDGNKDGKVSWGEWGAGKISPLKLKGSALVEVAMQGRADPDVIEKDPTFGNVAMNMFLNFARSLIADGIYAVYFSRAVKGLVSPASALITDNIVKQFAIRKGFEAAVKSAYDSAMK